MPGRKRSRSQFRIVAQSEEEERAFDIVKHRKGKLRNMFGSIAQINKGALGAGVLSGHVAFLKGGVEVGITLTFLNALLIFVCLNILVQSAHILYRRTKISTMSYSDVAQASFATFDYPIFQRWSKAFRYFVDSFIVMYLFGVCACYQIIIAHTIRQLVENNRITSLNGLQGYPTLRGYLAILIIPLILICLIRHLKYLAPFYTLGNSVIWICVIVTIVYSTKKNPNLEGMVPNTTFYGFFVFQGMNMFSLSCVGVIFNVENNMKNPSKFPIALLIGMCFITFSTFMISYFGYATYLENCEAPITTNYPPTIGAKVIRAATALMLYVSYGLNFWMPITTIFYHIRRRIKSKRILLELLCRAIAVLVITLIAVIFPFICALMGFISCLFLSNLAIILPALINTLVIYERPGFGFYKWRLVRNILLAVIGIFIMIFGTVINGVEIIRAFRDRK